MNIHKLPVGSGLAWFRQALDLGSRNPRAVFGAALLFIGTVYAMALVLSLPAVAMLRGAPGVDFTALLGWLAPLFLVVLLVVPVLLGGLMHVIREAEAGRDVRARDLFAPWRQRKAGRLAMLGLVQLLFGALSAVVVMALAGAGYWHDYMTAMQAAMGGSVPVMPAQEHPLLLLLFQLVFNYLTYAVMLFSIPLILFSGLSLGDAVRHSLRAAIRNVGANLLAALLFVGAMIVAAIVVVLLAGFASLLGNVVHGTLGALLGLLVFLAFGVVVMVVLTGGAYFAWRDTFAAPGADAPSAFAGIEA